jgi:cell division protease FtsH
MSEKVGPINYAERQGSDFLGTELLSGKWHSEDTARIIDKEIERILREAYETANEIVLEERAAIERLKDALLRYETLDAGEIDRLIAGADPAKLRPEPSVKRGAESQPARGSAAGGKEPASDDLGGLPGEAGLSPA